MCPLQEAASKFYSPVSLYKDPELLRIKEKKDYRLIRQYFSTKFGVHLCGGSKESEEIINDTVEGFHEELGLDDYQVAAIIKRKGGRKLDAIAGAIRTKQFMERYR